MRTFINAKTLFLGGLFCMASWASFAQENAPKDTTWDTGGDFALSLSQVGLSNWAGGGEGSLTLTSNLHLFANMTRTNSTWENDLQVGYGVIREGDRENPFKKNNDLIIFISRYNQRLSDQWSVSGLLDFRSQLANGFKYTFVDSIGQEVATKTSSFLAPGYLVAAVGITYVYKDLFKANLAPITGKFTFVMDDELAAAGTYGVDPGQNVRSQFGYSLSLNFTKKFTDDIEFRTNWLFFSDYQGLDNLDINGEAFLRFKINKWLSSNINTQLIWDRDIDIAKDDGTVGPAVQLRNVLNIGLAVDF